MNAYLNMQEEMTVLEMLMYIDFLTFSNPRASWINSREVRRMRMCLPLDVYFATQE